MPKKIRERKSIGQWDGEEILPGQRGDVRLAVSESYSGLTLPIPIHIRRGREDGPAVFVTAALHGDEINGTGAVRQLIQDESLELLRGSLALIPVLNILSFDRHSRYLPDRRDLNRCFPGTSRGSLASRMARTIFDEIVARCDYGIDLHTAAIRRTNYPSVRADMDLEAVQRIARASGGEIILNGRGPRGSFRREACAAGCPVIVIEGGEVWKVEPAIVESSVRAVMNILRELGMIQGKADRPGYQVIIDRTTWIRAERGGFLRFHVKPGDILDKDQPLATNTNLLGHDRSVLLAPFDSIVVGMTTLPAVSPGEPVCHLGELTGDIPPSELRRLRSREAGLEDRLVVDLASNVLVVEPPSSR